MICDSPSIAKYSHWIGMKISADAPERRPSSIGRVMAGNR